MNSDIRILVYRNKINPTDIMNEKEAIVRLPQEINPIAAYYGIYKERRDQKVSIADIIGYSYDKPNTNIVDCMDSLFDCEGDIYHTRSLGLLDYRAEEALERIDFDREKIVVEDMGDNKYIISTNGLHRYTVLRVIYLGEYMEVKYSKEKVEALREKYMIPVAFKELDEVKTYCKYLLMTAPCDVRDIKSVYDERKWCYTNSVEMIDKYDNRSTLRTDEDILRVVRFYAKTINQNIGLFKTTYSTCPGFRKFIKTYCSNFLDLRQLESDELEH